MRKRNKKRKKIQSKVKFNFDTFGFSFVDNKRWKSGTSFEENGR